MKIIGITYEDGNVSDVHVTTDGTDRVVLAPVRHGRWIVRGIDIDELAYGGRCYTPKYQCMVCGNIYESYRRYDEPVMPEDADYPNYCDNCGATMDGE